MALGRLQHLSLSSAGRSVTAAWRPVTHPCVTLLRRRHVWLDGFGSSRPVQRSGRCYNAGAGYFASCRWFATDRDPAVLIVDARQSVDLARAELGISLAAGNGRARMLTAGKRGVLVALQAAAAFLRRDTGGITFALSFATADELDAHGLAPPPETSSQDRKGEASQAVASVRRGFWLSFGSVGTSTPEGASSAEASGSKAKTVQKPAAILKVAAESPRLTLAKAIATTVNRLPKNQVAAVETLLKGKSKNVQNRTHRLAEAIATAHGWQVAPANEALASRPFRCTATVFETLENDVSLQTLRITLSPDGPPCPSRPQMQTSSLE